MSADQSTDTFFPPPANAAPEPPPFGWVVNPNRLTVNEVEEIVQISGLSPFAVETANDVITVGGYVAVAYARRLDPEKWPWLCARSIPVGDYTRSFPGDEEHQQSVAEAVAEAIEAGEEAPDPS